MMSAISYTVGELWERGKDNIPTDFISSCHLIYSSPATLSFNSPGAEGFGVKRAGLAVPGSVMLIVSPGCCGRNTSSISTMPGYEGRFFYLTMNETDLITGRHLKRIPEAVCHMARSLDEMPSVIMICITCVDALLGTDMERVCRQAEERLAAEVPEAADVKVRPCYMYALTREGRRPPMVHVRQSIYSLLPPMKKRASSVNIMGYFAPLSGNSELIGLLRQAGVRKVRQISTCESFEEFCGMGEANFNLILNPEARPAAQDLEERLGIPSIEMTRLYRADRIAAQYDALGAVLDVTFDYAGERSAAEDSVDRFRRRFPDAVFSVGEALNADPFEMALSLVTAGFAVKEIFGTVTSESFRYLRQLAALSPDTKVYSNLSPSMMAYSESHKDAGEDENLIALGRDAGWYHPDRPCLNWADDVQPFGFAAVRDLFDALCETAEGGRQDLNNDGIRLAAGEVRPVGTDRTQTDLDPEGKNTKGYRSVLTPFAPDQSGAVSVLYELGGMTVICDAGGCTGNICGFDEPRWFAHQSAVFSAGLRDMDAILGRDRELVDKVADAASGLDVNMIAIVGTPVPAVIGTDFLALSRMAEKASGLPAIGIPCDGMHNYDRGMERTYMELLRRFCSMDRPQNTAEGSAKGPVGVWGFGPMDADGLYDAADLRRALYRDLGVEEAVIYGEAQDGPKAFARASDVIENIVVGVSGLKAARELEKRCGIPYRCGNPAVEEKARRILKELKEEGGDSRTLKETEGVGRRILIVHEQITANAVRRVLREEGDAQVDAATFFDLDSELAEPGDLALKEESDFTAAVSKGQYDEIWADPVLKALMPGDSRARFVPLPHFAVSGSPV